MIVSKLNKTDHIEKSDWWINLKKIINYQNQIVLIVRIELFNIDDETKA